MQKQVFNQNDENKFSDKGMQEVYTLSSIAVKDRLKHEDSGDGRVRNN